MQFSEEVENDNDPLLHFYCLISRNCFKAIVTGQGIVWFFFPVLPLFRLNFIFYGASQSASNAFTSQREEPGPFRFTS